MRRSARLASGSKAAASPAPPAINLASVVEREESPVNEPTQSLDAIVSSPAKPPPQTPSTSSPLMPTVSEMHPSRFHQTMAPESSGLRLGFTDVNPPVNPLNRAANLQQKTPSKVNALSLPSHYHFSHSNTDLGLGPEAQRIMDEIREEAAKNKAKLIAERELERQEDEQVRGRRMAQPKGKAGRYSDIHMAEFKKMDSIANHPSAFRAQPGRFTPATTTKSLKRSQSKASLDDSETPRVKIPSQVRSSKQKRKSPDLQEPDSFAKRVRQHVDDDASSSRPASRDATNIPRPTTAGKDSASGIPRSQTLVSLMTPTKASLARSTRLKTPTAGRSLLKSPSKSTLGAMAPFSGIKKSATMHNLQAMDIDKEEDLKPARGQGRFDRVKSFFTRPTAKAAAPASAIPKPFSDMSKTPAPRRLEKEVPSVPFSTPGRKLPQRAQFTPETTKRAAITQNSPSPVKSGISRSKTSHNLVNYPSLNSVMEDTPTEPVLYPDLSAYRPLPEIPTKDTVVIAEKQAPLPEATPGTFSFRSDHTIKFDRVSPNGFGGNSGQASVRTVRPSIMPTSGMPGAFPLNSVRSSLSPGKENKPPQQPIFDIKVLPHGIGSKKRHRVADDEEDEEKETEERAAKKQKSAQVPEGEALVAPRLAQQKVSHLRTFGSPKKSPTKSRMPSSAKATPRKMTTSRLNMLAQPKNRN